MPRPLTTADLPDEAACFAETQISAGRFESVEAFIVAGMNAIKERDHSRLAALRAAIDEGDGSDLAEDGSFARVRARLGIAAR